jgi:hypothetical protein
MSIVANRWVLFPVAMIAGTVIFAAIAVAIAVGDGTAAEPDSYRKSVAWDAHRVQVAQNGLLGWVVTPTVSGGSGRDGAVVLRIGVADKHAVPIDGGRVVVEVVPIRDADRRVTLELKEVAPGTYEASCPVRVSGQWEIRTTIESRGKRYADRVRRFVDLGAGGAVSREHRK